MKKTVFFMIILAVLAGGCKKNKDEKSTALRYYDSDPIHMVFQDTHTIAVESDYDISYEIIRTNPYPVLRWQSHGVLKSLNVGTDKVTISNGYETKTVDVVVDVFTEPTFEFGCAPARIRELYGTKYQGAYVTDHDIQYLRYVYIGDESNNYMYSPTCYHMDFYFQDSQYIVSQVFIRKNNIEIPLKNYIDDNFDSLRTIPKYYYDEYITHDTVPAIVYRSKTDENVLCIKYEHANQYDDISLVYREDETENLK